MKKSLNDDKVTEALCLTNLNNITLYADATSQIISASNNEQLVHKVTTSLRLK